MKRFGTAVERVDERIPGVELPLMSVSRTRGVIRRSELTDAPARAESLDAYKVCRKGDIVFNKMSIRDGALGVAPEDGLVTYHYEVMRPRRDTKARYVAYLMKSSWFTSELIRRERGIGSGDQANVRTTEVPFSVLKTIQAHFPPTAEQQQIADYLDRETAQIDTLIEAQQQLVAMLGERRVAVVAHTTSQGAEVEFRRIIATLRQGWSPNCENWPADGTTEWGVLKVGCANTGRFDPKENKRLPDSAIPRQEFAVREGEIVMSRSNTKDRVGAAAVVNGHYPRLLLSDLTYSISITSRADPQFVAYALASPALRMQIGAASKGMSHTMQKISQRDIRELRLRLPALAKQREIAKVLDGKTAEIDQLIAEAERFIELSRERRSALITAAVTGQLDVRDEVV